MGELRATIGFAGKMLSGIKQSVPVVCRINQCVALKRLSAK